MRIALDMDGVIANFTKQACRVMGEPYPSKYIFKNYSWIFDKYGEHSCYKRMRGHLFWTSIEPYPWIDKLIKLIDEESGGNWIFLTKPMIDPYCYSGKAEWIMKHKPKYLNKLLICAADKANLVRNKQDILIDDKAGNCEDWNSVGGSSFFWEEVSDDYDNEFINNRLQSLKVFLNNIKIEYK